MSPDAMRDLSGIDPYAHAIESRHWGGRSCHLVRHEGRYYAGLAGVTPVPWCTQWPARRLPAASSTTGRPPTCCTRPGTKGSSTSSCSIPAEARGTQIPRAAPRCPHHLPVRGRRCRRRRDLGSQLRGHHERQGRPRRPRCLHVGPVRRSRIGLARVRGGCGTSRRPRRARAGQYRPEMWLPGCCATGRPRPGLAPRAPRWATLSAAASGSFARARSISPLASAIGISREFLYRVLAGDEWTWPRGPRTRPPGSRLPDTPVTTLATYTVDSHQFALVSYIDTAGSKCVAVDQDGERGAAVCDVEISAKDLVQRWYDDGLENHGARSRRRVRPGA